MDKRFFWIVTGILSVVVLAGTVATVLMRMPQAFAGSVINPPSPASDFSLTSQTGGTVHLADYRGKYVLLFFGYSHCLDQCPATMAVLSKARSELGAQAENVQVLFISTDPAHDTEQSMGAFLSRFDPTFIGLTGSMEQLQPIWKEYGVTVQDGGETHSSYTYLIDPNGNLRLTYPYPSTPEEISADLKILFKKN
jgi:protein SCO1/2